MAKKEKLGVDKIVKRVNKEFEKTSGQIETLISDALKQLDNLQNQIQEPIRKILDEMDRLREREFARFQEEFDRRVQEFQNLQNNLLERVGIAPKGKREKPTTESGKSVPSSAESGAKAAEKAGVKKSAAPAAAKKPATKPKASAAAKAPSQPKLSDIKGVGPATIKKMKAMGIDSVKQVANPTPEEKKKLDEFSSMKGYDSWQSQARKLLD